MHIKIEGEHLNFLRYNPKKLQAEQHIHLRGAFATDGHVATAGQLVVLPATCTGSPCYMHQRTQDAMTYAHQYGTPDLFITFTCNPNWHDITSNLMPSQRLRDCYDIMSHILHLKQNNMLVIKQKEVFGKVQWDMFTVMAKAGPSSCTHTHLVAHQTEATGSWQIHLYRDTRSNRRLFNIITSHMIHGPCGHVNHNSPCMKDEVCSKRYSRPCEEIDLGRWTGHSHWQPLNCAILPPPLQHVWCPHQCGVLSVCQIHKICLQVCEQGTRHGHIPDWGWQYRWDCLLSGR